MRRSISYICEMGNFFIKMIEVDRDGKLTDRDGKLTDRDGKLTDISQESALLAPDILSKDPFLVHWTN